MQSCPFLLPIGILGPREAKQLVPGHTAGQRTRGLGPGLLLLLSPCRLSLLLFLRPVLGYAGLSVLVCLLLLLLA